MGLPARRSLLGEYAAEPQVVGQVQQCHLMPEMGPHPFLLPPLHRVEIGPEAAGDLRPRQARLLLEPLQPLGEVVGEVGRSSSVMDALSRHRSFRRTAVISLLLRCTGPSGAQDRRRSARLPAGTVSLLQVIDVCGLFFLPSIGGAGAPVPRVARPARRWRTEAGPELMGTPPRKIYSVTSVTGSV